MAGLNPAGLTRSRIIFHMNSEMQGNGAYTATKGGKPGGENDVGDAGGGGEAVDEVSQWC